jgi:hypothetical protein
VVEDVFSNLAHALTDAVQTNTEPPEDPPPPRPGQDTDTDADADADADTTAPAGAADTPIGDASAPETAPADTAAVVESAVTDTPDSFISEDCGGVCSDSTVLKSETPPDIFEDTQIDKTATAVADARPPPPSPPPPPPPEEAPSDEAPPFPTDEALENALSNMIQHHVLPDPAVRHEVCNYGRKKSAHLLLAEEYDEAAAVDLAVDIIFVNIRQDECQQDEAAQTQTLEQRLEQVKEDGARIVADNDAWIGMARDRTRETLQRLLQFHAQECADFKLFWARPEARLPFSKPSPELLQSRQKQKAAALVHDFASAKAMTLQAEALERREAADGARRFASALTVAYAQLIERQQREIDCVVAKGDVNVSVLALGRDQQVRSNDRTQRSLELRIASPKQQKKPTIQLPIVKPRTPLTTVAVPGMITQRTRTQLAGYRKSPEMIRLQIPPQDPEAILQASALKPVTVPTV